MRGSSSAARGGAARSSGPISVAILGFGTVGTAVARLLGERDGMPVRLTHVFNRDVARKRVDWVPDDVVWTEDVDEVLRSDVDVIVELVGGAEPAGTWVWRALEAGKSVVTANKPLVARAGTALAEAAARSGAQLGFEASVAGGVPIVGALLDGLAGDRLDAVTGILNGTCNFVLTRIETAGATFDAALREAQALGFAEADPTDDVEGYDARDKLVILTRLGLRATVDPEAVPCGAVASVEAADFTVAHRLGCTIRQISRARRGADAAAAISASVRPAFVAAGSALAAVEGSQNIVRLTGRHGGETTLVGRGAGGEATAVAVISDLLAIARGRRRPCPSEGRIAAPDAVADDFTTPHVVRVSAVGEAPPTDAVRAALADHGIHVRDSLELDPRADGRRVAALRVERCASNLIASALGGSNGDGPGRPHPRGVTPGSWVVYPVIEEEP